MSYKVYLRVRPIDFEQSMIHIDKNSINIKVDINIIDIILGSD